MKNLIRLTDYKAKDVYEIFDIADEIIQGKYKDILNGKTVVLFFPNSSIRTRVTFEKGIRLLGGQAVLFPSDTLDKRENSKDVIGYLNNWADVIVVRHKDITMLETMSQYSKVPVINALTAINHPCEMLADMYALSKIRKDFTKDKYLFCGLKGNIGLAWKEAADVMGFELSQCCADGYEMEGVPVYHNIVDAIIGKDIVCTDSLPSDVLEKSSGCQVTKAVMEKANKGAVLNPCPPFYRGEEVSGDVIDSEYFVGYEFKKYLLEIQQAVIIYCMIH
ncbi:ornithine carbamoyltransferase [Eisenbergiella tayi]|uniref:Ornithine carbamoyltransferase n=1 Tax=Eisenbergiella tayi TaxID=1432052 RepID=A0A1E3A5J8_9FIRM|nr:peptide transporter [Eisenbergiella tayi]ODM03998.1 Ornithine carbamoyltransferase [Eisenbergiella tayi]ODR31892.1 peptide transporter [Eisenbergiella tayi]